MDPVRGREKVILARWGARISWWDHFHLREGPDPGPLHAVWETLFPRVVALKKGGSVEAGNPAPIDLQFNNPPMRPGGLGKMGKRGKFWREWTLLFVCLGRI